MTVGLHVPALSAQGEVALPLLLPFCPLMLSKHRGFFSLQMCTPGCKWNLAISKLIAAFERRYHIAKVHSVHFSGFTIAFSRTLKERILLAQIDVATWLHLQQDPRLSFPLSGSADPPLQPGILSRKECPESPSSALLTTYFAYQGQRQGQFATLSCAVDCVYRLDLLSLIL